MVLTVNFMVNFFQHSFLSASSKFSSFMFIGEDPIKKGGIIEWASEEELSLFFAWWTAFLFFVCLSNREKNYSVFIQLTHSLTSFPTVLQHWTAHISTKKKSIMHKGRFFGPNTASRDKDRYRFYLEKYADLDLPRLIMCAHSIHDRDKGGKVWKTVLRL